MNSLISKETSEYREQTTYIRQQFVGLIDRLQFDDKNKIINNRENKNILLRGTHELRKNLNEGYMKQVVQNYGNNLLLLIDYTIEELQPDITVTADEKNEITYNVYKFIKYDGFAESSGSELKRLYLDKSDFSNLLFSHESSIKFGRTREEIKDITSRYVDGVMRIAFNRITPDIFVETYRYINELIGKDETKDYDWYYEGTLVEESRAFCKARNGKTFTTEEVKSWKDEDWPEKQPYRYNPWRDCGGFGCTHVLKPRAKKQQPAERSWKNTGHGYFMYK